MKQRNQEGVDHFVTLHYCYGHIVTGIMGKRSFKNPGLITARVGQLRADQNLSTPNLWSEQGSTFHHASWLESGDKSCRLSNDLVPKNGAAIINSWVSFQKWGKLLKLKKKNPQVCCK